MVKFYEPQIKEVQAMLFKGTEECVKIATDWLCGMVDFRIEKIEKKPDGEIAILIRSPKGILICNPNHYIVFDYYNGVCLKDKDTFERTHKPIKELFEYKAVLPTTASNIKDTRLEKKRWWDL